MRHGRLRVLVLADSWSFHAERYVAELRRQGCRVLLASIEKGSVHHFRLKRRGRIRALHYVLAAAEIRTLIRRFRPGVVNPHFASGYGFATSLAAVGQSAPVLLHLWGSDVLIVPHKTILHRYKTRRALQAADFVIGDSELLLRRAERIGKVRAGRTIAWGLEKKFLWMHKQDYRLGRPLRVIVPRPHEKVYNNQLLVRALGPLIDNGTIKMTFPEFGSLAGEFRKIADRSTENGVHYYPRLARPEFMNLMAAHDVYLSGSASDSSPASLIEAMGLGLIPVVADIPGVREWLGPDNGYTYELPGVKGLRSVFEMLVEKDDNHEQMRRRNLEQVKKRALFEDNISETIAIMSDLVEKHDQ